MAMISKSAPMTDTETGDWPLEPPMTNDRISEERLREIAEGYEIWSKTNSAQPEISRDTANALRELIARRKMVVKP
jgi:hypothetical protein